MRFTISKKIGLGFTIIILFVVFNGFFSVITLNKSRQIEEQNSQIIEPSLKKLTELSLLITRAKMQTVNWVHFPNSDDKVSLEGIIMIEYPLLKEELVQLSEKWKNKEIAIKLNPILHNADTLFISADKIMSNLQSVEDYNDPLQFFTATTIIEDEVQPSANKVLLHTEKLINQVKNESENSKVKMLQSFKTLENTLLISFLILLIVTISSLYFTTKSITGPVNKLKKLLQKISKGELPSAINLKNTDEIRDMEDEINKVVRSLKKNVHFAQKIGKGEFNLPYTKLSDKDELGGALLEMKSNLLSTTKFAEAIGNSDYTAQYTLKSEADQLGSSLITMKVGLMNAKQELENINEEINKKNTSILDSINYAMNIQQSIVPNKSNLKELFTDSLMFYKTKDLVSGDIPWIYKKENYCYAAIIDCTGHGVPGALLSIVAHFTLSNIMSHSNPLKPSDILQKLHTGVVKALTNYSEIQIADGMDIALIRFDRNTNELIFAGANRPLFKLSNSEISIYKGNRRPIGGQDYNDDKFIDQTITVNKGDAIFIFSDGIVDQFGGPNDKKYMTARLKKLLILNSSQPMPDVERRIEKDFYDWKGNTEQTDDVIIMGIKF